MGFSTASVTFDHRKVPSRPLVCLANLLPRRMLIGSRGRAGAGPTAPPVAVARVGAEQRVSDLPAASTAKTKRHGIAGWLRRGAAPGGQSSWHDDFCHIVSARAGHRPRATNAGKPDPVRHAPLEGRLSLGPHRRRQRPVPEAHQRASTGPQRTIPGRSPAIRSAASHTICTISCVVMALYIN